MSTRPAEVRIRAWTWKSHDTPITVQGLRLYNSNGRGVFIAYTDAHEIANVIVDHAEQHERDRMSTDSAIEIKNFFWAPLPGGQKERGIRIQRGRGWIFVPNDELLDLANALADHIERNRA